jgi:hypothetical protein
MRFCSQPEHFALLDDVGVDLVEMPVGPNVNSTGTFKSKYRLLWGSGLPPWHTMNIFNYFEGLGAVFVGETAVEFFPF